MMKMDDHSQCEFRKKINANGICGKINLDITKKEHTNTPIDMLQMIASSPMPFQPPSRL
jgi:hypothetical protein